MRIKGGGCIVLLCLVIFTLLSVGYYYSISNQILKQVVGLDIQSTKNSSKAYNGISKEQNKGVDSVTVAHAITMTRCDRLPKMGGAIEPLMILRHSIHRNSVHSKGSTSRYSYQMIAFVYRDGAECTELIPLLEQIGYRTLIVDVPIDVDAISNNDFYRTEVKDNGCCGEAEFIKVLSLNLTEFPIVVHWDVDAFARLPLDDAFDVILYGKETSEGQIARQRLEIERPKIQRVPEGSIDFLYTTEEINALEHPPINGGFLIFRTSSERFHDILRVIMRANYTKTNGWGDMGYGGDGGGAYMYPGAMTIQGFMGYYYQQIYKGRSLELDNCRWNQSSKRLAHWNGTHTNCDKKPGPGISLEDNTAENGMCEDCTTVPFEERRTIHFQSGRKPWFCQLKNKFNPWRSMSPSLHEYFGLRRELEDQIASAMEKEPPSYNGTFHPDIFLNFCKEQPIKHTTKHSKGKEEYGELIPLPALPLDFQMKNVYGL